MTIESALPPSGGLGGLVLGFWDSLPARAFGGGAFGGVSSERVRPAAPFRTKTRSNKPARSQGKGHPRPITWAPEPGSVASAHRNRWYVCRRAGGRDRSLCRPAMARGPARVGREARKTRSAKSGGGQWSVIWMNRSDRYDETRC